MFLIWDQFFAPENNQEGIIYILCVLLAIIFGIISKNKQIDSLEAKKKGMSLEDYRKAKKSEK